MPSPSNTRDVGSGVTLVMSRCASREIHTNGTSGAPVNVETSDKRPIPLPVNVAVTVGARKRPVKGNGATTVAGTPAAGAGGTTNGKPVSITDPPKSRPTPMKVSPRYVTVPPRELPSHSAENAEVSPGARQQPPGSNLPSLSRDSKENPPVPNRRSMPNDDNGSMTSIVPDVRVMVIGSARTGAAESRSTPSGAAKQDRSRRILASASQELSRAVRAA